jgi:lysine/ornithine N-monooxygenase
VPYTIAISASRRMVKEEQHKDVKIHWESVKKFFETDNSEYSLQMFLPTNTQFFWKRSGGYLKR